MTGDLRIPIYQILGAGAILGTVGVMTGDRTTRRWAYIGAFAVPALLVGVNLIDHYRRQKGQEPEKLATKPSDTGRDIAAPSGSKPGSLTLEVIDEEEDYIEPGSAERPWWMFWADDTTVPPNSPAADAPVNTGNLYRR